MTDYIVFSVGANRYALEIADIHRIIQVPDITVIPDAHPYIEGMISYEEEVTHVLSFRRMLEQPTYKEELTTLFESLKTYHKKWVEQLSQAIIEGSKFTEPVDAHSCELGKWVNNFTARDEKVAPVLKELKKQHNSLHRLAEELLKLRQSDEMRAIERLQNEVNDLYGKTVAELDRFIKMSGMIADSLQKLLIYQGGSGLFAIKVDTIEDIRHVDTSDLRQSEGEGKMGQFLKIDGVLEIDKKLINIIKSVTLPKNEV